MVPPEPIGHEVSGLGCVSLPVSVDWGCFGLACAAVLMLRFADLINCAGLSNTRQQALM